MFIGLLWGIRFYFLFWVEGWGAFYGRGVSVSLCLLGCLCLLCACRFPLEFLPFVCPLLCILRSVDSVCSPSCTFVLSIIYDSVGYFTRFLLLFLHCCSVLVSLDVWSYLVMTRTYKPIFIYLTWCTDTGVIVTHAFIFLPASGPIVLVDSCAARCCDSELRLTVHCCVL